MAAMFEESGRIIVIHLEHVRSASILVGIISERDGTSIPVGTSDRALLAE